MASVCICNRAASTAPRLFYALPQADLQIEFLPSDFIQVNASVNRELVAASAQLLQLTAESSLLDLYCGLGNFSLALARRARCVVGVEGDAGLVARARGAGFSLTSDLSGAEAIFYGAQSPARRNSWRRRGRPGSARPPTASRHRSPARPPRPAASA